jgi:transposase
MPRHDLTDREFNAIRHLLPSQKNKRPRRPWMDHRTVISGIMWILKTGAPWRDLPAELGKWQTVYARFRRWTNEDLWVRIYRTLLKRVDVLEKIDRSLWCVDGSVIRAHRCASGMLPQSDENDELNALGRSRGGYSTKLHLLCDAQGTLLAVTATGGQRHESQEFENLMIHCELSLHRYSSRPEAIAGDKGTVRATFAKVFESERSSQSSRVEPMRLGTWNSTAINIEEETSSKGLSAG